MGVKKTDLSDILKGEWIGVRNSPWCQGSNLDKFKVSLTKGGLRELGMTLRNTEGGTFLESK